MAVGDSPQTAASAAPGLLLQRDTAPPAPDPLDGETAVTDTATMGAAELPGAVPLPSDPYLVLQALQLVMLCAAALYVTRSIAMPIVLAMVLRLLLQPAVRTLERWRIPRGLAAALVLLALIGLIVSLATALSGPAREWADKLPDALDRLRERLSFVSGPVDTLLRLLHDAERVAQGEPAMPSAPAPLGLAEMLFSGTASFASGFFTTMIVLFFLLASGDLFLRRFVEVLPRFRDKRQAVMISQQVESDVAAYLRTVTMMSAAVGVATALFMWFCGLGNPVLWGAMAFLLNYVPILGPTVCIGLLVLAGLLTQDQLGPALMPAIGYVVIHIMEGQIVTPMLIARRFTLNPVAVIISLIFWYWMWGVPGAMLAVPMLGIVRIICSGVRPWAAVGHLLGD